MLLERDEDLARVAAAIGEPGCVLVVEGEAGSPSAASRSLSP
jgi:ABC-type sugar transport system substrate-binding protein